VILTTPANVPDQRPLLAMLDSMPPVRMPRGRPRYKPGAAVADRAYGTAEMIREVLQRRIVSLLAPRNSGHGSGLGQVRYVIERTLSWMGNFRRLTLCYERTGSHWQAFHELAACLICANRVAALAKSKVAA
jgi:transposase